MQWEKLGRIWLPPGDIDWAQSHASVPVVLPQPNGLWAILLSTRDAQGKSRIGRLLLDPTPLPHQVPTVCHFDPTPVLSLGVPGAFDDCGTMPSWLVEHQGRIYLYYVGWNVPTTVPYRVSLGLAISDDGGQTFHRFSTGPILDRSTEDPFFVTLNCVRNEHERWRMWYTSCSGWQQVLGRWEPTYHLKYAESLDGIAWKTTGAACVYLGEDFAVTRPCVFRTADKYAMLYSYRSTRHYRTDPHSGYRLGYAESNDGLHWEIQNELAGIERSAVGDDWDADMIEYAWLQTDGQQTYLLYNGNGFGRSGVGIARLEA